MNTRESVVKGAIVKNNIVRYVKTFIHFGNDVFDAATSSTAAKYQARIKQLEEWCKELRTICSEAIPEFNIPELNESLSTTSPDKALQRALLDAEIKGFADCYGTEKQLRYSTLVRMRLKYAALEGE